MVQLLNNYSFLLSLGVVYEFDADKTAIIRAHNFSRRCLGKEQMTMDTAAIVVHKIINEQVPFVSLEFVDRPVLKINKHERVKMNFRYLRDANGKLLISKGVLDVLRDTSSFDVGQLE